MVDFHLTRFLNLSCHFMVDYFGYLKGTITIMWKKKCAQIKIKTQKQTNDFKNQNLKRVKSKGEIFLK